MKKQLLSVLSLATLLTLSACGVEDFVSPSVEANSTANSNTENSTPAGENSTPKADDSANNGETSNPTSDPITPEQKSTIITDAIKNLMNTKAVTIKLNGSFVYDGETIDLSKSELVLVADSKQGVKAYVTASGKMESELGSANVAVTGAIENGKAYLEVDNFPTQYSSENWITGESSTYFTTNNMAAIVPLEVITGNLGDEFALLLNNYEAIYNFQVNGLYPFINGVIDYFATEANEVGIALINSIFDVTEVGDTYSVTLNVEKGFNLLKSLNGKNVIEVFDTLVGEGKFDAYTLKLLAFTNNTFGQLFTALKAKGADVEALLDAGNELCKAIYGKSFEEKYGTDPKSLLNDTFLNAKISETIMNNIKGEETTVTFESYLAEMIEFLKTVTIDLDGDSEGEEAEEEFSVEDLETYVSMIKDMLSLNVTINKDGTNPVTSLTGAFENEYVSVNGALNVSYTGSKSEGFDSFVSSYDALIEKFAVTSDMFNLFALDEDVEHELVLDSTGKYVNSYKEIYSSYTNTYDFTKPVGYEIESACGDKVVVSLIVSYTQADEDESYSGYTQYDAFSFVYDTKTDTISSAENEDYYCNFVVDESKTEVSGEGCEATTTEHSFCSVCNKEQVVTTTPGHSWVYEVVMNGESCEDGWYEQRVCSKCGKENEDDDYDVVYDHYEHPTYVSLEEYDIEADIVVCGCPCGALLEYVYISFDWDDESIKVDYNAMIDEETWGTSYDFGNAVVYKYSTYDEEYHETYNFVIYKDGKQVASYQYASAYPESEEEYEIVPEA